MVSVSLQRRFSPLRQYFLLLRERQCHLADIYTRFAILVHSHVFSVKILYISDFLKLCVGMSAEHEVYVGSDE